MPHTIMNNVLNATNYTIRRQQLIFCTCTMQKADYNTKKHHNNLTTKDLKGQVEKFIN